MSAQPGWYPDPGGVPNLYRYWDGQAWSAATSPNPQSPPPSQGLVPGQSPYQGSAGQAPYGQAPYGQTPHGQTPYEYEQGQPGAYAGAQATQTRKSPVGWWIAAGALLVVIIVIGVIAVRAIGGSGLTGTGGGTQPSQDVCPTTTTGPSESAKAHPNDGRVHGGPVSYPQLGSPWSPPVPDNRVPFGRDTATQQVSDQENYDGQGNSWVASVLVAELMAGDGFYTPEQGAQIVVRCILGAFYGDNPVTSDVRVSEAATVDGHDAWRVESQLSFDIPGLIAKGELLIVVVVNAGETSGLYYASIPDTQPQLVQPAREALANLTVDV